MNILKKLMVEFFHANKALWSFVKILESCKGGGAYAFHYSTVYAIAYGIVYAGERPVADHPPGMPKPKNENVARPQGLLHTQKICKMKV